MLIYDSRCLSYKTPFGAAPAGQPVRLRAYTPAGGLSALSVVYYRDYEPWQTLRLLPEKPSADPEGVWFAGSLLLDCPQVYWYFFTGIDRDGQPRVYHRNPDDNTVLEAAEGATWQLTVYDPAFATPDRHKGGVMYQIFPDRYAIGHAPPLPRPKSDENKPDAAPFSPAQAGPQAGPAGENRAEAGLFSSDRCRAEAAGEWNGAGLYGPGGIGGNCAPGVSSGCSAPAGSAHSVDAAPWLQSVLAGRWYHRDLEEPPAYLYPDKETACNDYYGGNLAGITERLDGLAALSVDKIYLNPIFEAHSNHRYNTADYTHIDPLLGTREAFIALLDAARRRGIGILLDGVFSHTGSDSVYFNKAGRYPSVGAYQSKDSPYYAWYRFQKHPDEYTAWWGVPTLPETNEDDPGFQAFVLSVLQLWQSMGAAGWRLDVADELPDDFLRALRRTVKGVDPDALILGEVWEDASNKISYGVRREYLLGGELDSVMNYPFRSAILRYLLEGDAQGFARTVLSIVENYPRPALDLLMNPLSTHDTPRVLTVLGGENPEAMTKEQQAAYRLSPERRLLATRRLVPAVVLQYTLPGFPSVYYGDEVLMEGCGDPFCRMFYTERNRDEEIYDMYVQLGRLRSSASCYRSGGFELLRCDNDCLVFARDDGLQRLVTAVNRTENAVPLSEPLGAPVFAKGLAPDGKRLEAYGAAICADRPKGGLVGPA